jgi:hypothetical protein
MVAGVIAVAVRRTTPTRLLVTSSTRLRSRADAQVRLDLKEQQMTILTRILAGLAIGAIGAVAAAGAYTEARRAPDQS